MPGRMSSNELCRRMVFEPVTQRLVHARLPTTTCGTESRQHIGTVPHCHLLLGRATVRPTGLGSPHLDSALFQHRTLPVGNPGAFSIPLISNLLIPHCAP